jgi:hypothetical protein
MHTNNPSAPFIARCKMFCIQYLVAWAVPHDDFQLVQRHMQDYIHTPQNITLTSESFFGRGYRCGHVASRTGYVRCTDTCVPLATVTTCTTATNVNATAPDLSYDAVQSAGGPGAGGSGAGGSGEKRHNIQPYPEIITESVASMLAQHELTPTQLKHVELAWIPSNKLMAKKKHEEWPVTRKRLFRFQPQELMNDECVGFGLGRIQEYLDGQKVDATKVVLAHPLLWTTVREYVRLKDEGGSEDAIKLQAGSVIAFLPREDTANTANTGRGNRKNVFASAERAILIASGGCHFTTVVVTGMNKPGEKPTVEVLDSHSLSTIRRCLQALADVVWEATGTPKGVPRFTISR